MLDSICPITVEDIAELASSLKLDFSDVTRQDVLRSLETIDVQACPGSGKTTMVAAKLVLLSKNWPFTHRGICALTHTNVAKEEIINCLKRSPVEQARSLLQYPHFIGTIQEFTNRFLALPRIRSTNSRSVTVDNDQYTEVGLGLLSRNDYFGNRIRGAFPTERLQRNFLNSTYEILQDGRLIVNIAALPNSWQNQANYDRALDGLRALKQQFIRQNVFLFRDMYSHAEAALKTTPELSEVIVQRFPMLFIDEMQDTQMFQDQLLRGIFAAPEATRSIMQRFGDPDQAIFSGGTGERANETFNAKNRDAMDYVLNGSHRYCSGIANKIRPFSLNEVELHSVNSPEKLATRTLKHSEGLQFEHTVFVFDDRTIIKVISDFCKHVSEQFSQATIGNPNFTVKAVGAVGADIEPNKNQLRIGHYWPNYRKSNPASVKNHETLIEVIREARKQQSPDSISAYKIVLKGFLKLLNLANLRDADGLKFQRTTLKNYLSKRGHWKTFRKFLYWLLSPDFLDTDRIWTIIKQKLHIWFELAPISDPARDFLVYDPIAELVAPVAEPDVGALTAIDNNSLMYEDLFRCQLSTIHNVKGETHDATLVLETKNSCHDVSGMISHLTGALPNLNSRNRGLRPKPHHTAGNCASQQFLQQLFVAMSRPKHLLCVAIHTDRLSEEERQNLIAAGWGIKNVIPVPEI